MALVYLVHHFFYHLLEFLRHWYVKSVKIYSNFVLRKLEQIDYVLAWQITLKYLFQPLYRDYSVIGYILGFIFRLGRLLIGTIVYAFIFFIAVAFYIIWLLTPPYIIYRVFIG